MSSYIVTMAQSCIHFACCWHMSSTKSFLLTSFNTSNFSTSHISWHSNTQWIPFNLSFRASLLEADTIFCLIAASSGHLKYIQQDVFVKHRCPGYFVWYVPQAFENLIYRGNYNLCLVSPNEAKILTSYIFNQPHPMGMSVVMWCEVWVQGFFWLNWTMREFFISGHLDEKIQ